MNTFSATKQLNHVIAGLCTTELELFVILGLVMLIFSMILTSLIAKHIYARLQTEYKLAASKKKLQTSIRNLTRHNQELQLLKELTTALLTSISYEHAMEQFGRFTQRILKNTACAIYVPDKHQAKQLNPLISWGRLQNIPRSLQVNECLALTTQQPYLIDGNKTESSCQHLHQPGDRVKKSVCIPLYMQNMVLGLLYVENITNQRLLSLLEVMVEQVSLSLYNIKLRDELMLQSMHDSLTGLANRRFFEQYVYKEIQQASRESLHFAILLLDIDGFKQINDAYGHSMGDRVLQAVAQQLQVNCRQSDLVARWGGEEFAIFFRDITEQQAQTRAEEIRLAIELLEIAHPQTTRHIMITVSIGIALFPEDADNIEHLISISDQALYTAKKNGKNQVILFQGIT